MTDIFRKDATEMQNKTTNQKRKPCDFEDLLDLVGSENKYQKYLLYGFLGALTTFAPFLESSPLFILDIPNYWCHVPGNYTNLEEWKNQTLPMELGPDNKPRYKLCEMYDPKDHDRTIPCQNGYDYDKTDYESTLSSENNWVCDKEHYASSILSVGTAGAAIGNLLFGILADRIGRKPTYFIACVVCFLFRVAALFATSIEAMRALWFFSCLAVMTVNYLPVTWVAEVAGTDYRSWIFSFIWMVYVLGNSILPLLMWILREWFIFGIITTIPFIFIPLSFPFVMESPRWLISMGRGKEAFEIIKKIASVNGKTVEDEVLDGMVQDLLTRRQQDLDMNKNSGLSSVFQSKRLLWHTLLLIIASSTNGLLYSGTTLNSLSMAGNKFFNYFILSLIELPAGYFAGLLVEKTGRRWTQPAFFMVSIVFGIICAISTIYPKVEIVQIIGALGVKVGISVSLVVLMLQCNELFPTFLRTTGSGIIGTASCIIGTASPFIVLTGKSNAAFPYLLFILIAIIGMLFSSCLPETLYHTLPESLDEANEFGKYQKFWSYLPKDVTKIKLERQSTRRKSVIKSSIRRASIDDYQVD